MDDMMNLQQVIYGFLETQIKIGAYRLGDPLPTIEEASRWFSVSLDTVRPAYLRLKQEGFITLAQKAGAAVTVQYGAEEIEQHTQEFFAPRRESVGDLCRSLGPLFNRAQWVALKNAPQERLDELERLCSKQNVLLSYTMARHVHLIYSTLNNRLLLRLVWQAFMFFQGAFLGLPENIAAFKDGDGPLLSMIGLCRKKDWAGLWRAIEGFQKQLSSAVGRFYGERIAWKPSGQPISFHWNAYQKPSQRCYSLAIGLLKDIRHGIYPEGDFLPSPAKLAEDKQAPVITIRRALALLNRLGVTRSINGVGTQVLDTEDSAANCDFSQPAIQKRLSDFAESLQILALTCKASTEITVAAIDDSSIQQWKDRLLLLKQDRRYEVIPYASVMEISRLAPVRAVREVYAQLLQILLWGYPLRSVHGSHWVAASYLPHIDYMAECLERRDGAGLALELEAIMTYELRFAVAHLKEWGISSVSNLVIPER